MDIKEILFKLSNADAVGCVTEASAVAKDLLKNYAEVKETDNLSVIGFIKGKSDYTLLLDAHIDQIAMIVTDIDDNGFLTVSNSGGIDIRALPARCVTVHGKEKIKAVFCSTPPHLASGETEYKDIADIKLDTGLGGKAKEIVSVGDYVTFNAKPLELANGIVCGRSFDNRASVACLIELASRIYKRELPFNVAFLFSDAEELGMRGAVTSCFDIDPQEAIVLDVSFGDGIGIPENECGKLGEGGMIGFSPVLSSEVSNRLLSIAKEKYISYQTEIMGGKTGTNADVISVSRGGVKTATLSIPLRNMHTEVETLAVSDLNSVCNLLEEYILSGGVGCA